MLVGGLTPAFAMDFTAGVVMSKMKPEERYPFIAGVVEGLAYGRFVHDEKKTEGMGCVYDWFYKEPKTVDVIYAAFGKFPDHLPGAVIAALVKRKCGE
ncbi:hypothetical protein AIGOOFII_3158 [Methylobacterium marchantiae]|nr:hypothetical protein AIGOOFII_3158 [Methylobacterium marchantiae]